MPSSKKFGMIMISIIAAIVLIATYYMNGAERKDVWLYIVSFWLVVMGAISGFSRKYKN